MVMEGLYAEEQNGHETGFDTWILDVLGVAQEGDADLHDLVTLLGRDDVRDVLSDELEVVDDVIQEVLREGSESVRLLRL